MIVRLHAPYFERGEILFPAGLIEMPDHLASIEIAKGLAELARLAEVPPPVVAKAEEPPAPPRRRSR